MAEYVVGHEFVREPDGLLPEGAVVETHTHNHHHNTHLTRGLWEVHRYQPIIGSAEPAWVELPVIQVQGGGPRSIVPIPANMKHKFVLLKGWGFYRCVFAHRDPEGALAEVFHGYEDAYR
jgi:hypothetical protein